MYRQILHCCGIFSLILMLARPLSAAPIYKILETDADYLWNSTFSYIWSHSDEFEIVRQDEKHRLLQFRLLETKRGEKKVVDPNCTLQVIALKAKPPPKKKKVKGTGQWVDPSEEKKKEAEEKAKQEQAAPPPPRAKIKLDMSRQPRQNIIVLLDKLLKAYRDDSGAR